MPKDRVTILLLGDEGVGKSCLISSYISRHFPQEVPAVMTNATVPPQKTANNIAVMIIDSSAREGDMEVLNQKVELVMYERIQMISITIIMKYF